MPLITLQLDITEDMARQLELLSSKDVPQPIVLQTALQLGLLDLMDTANRVHRDFIEQWAIAATGHFGKLRESRNMSVATKPTLLPNDVTASAKGGTWRA